MENMIAAHNLYEQAQISYRPFHHQADWRSNP